MTLVEQRKIAIRAARVQLYKNGNPLTVKGAELVLDEMARTEPDLIASQWFINASQAQWNLFKKEWKKEIEWKNEH